jgi:hypothetical protein
MGGGGLEIDGAEKGQGPYGQQLIFHVSFGRKFTELKPVSPKLEVHGQGTKTTGNDQTTTHPVPYNKYICNLFCTEATNSTPAGGWLKLPKRLFIQFAHAAAVNSLIWVILAAGKQVTASVVYAAAGQCCYPDASDGGAFYWHWLID